MQLSNAYKTIPLYLEVGIRKMDSYAVNPEDSVFASAVYYISQSAAYLKASEFEQMVNDSMALLIDNSTRHMVLYEQAAAVIQRMRKAMTLSFFPDSSLQYLAGRYTASKERGEKDTEKLILSGRLLIPGTDLPRDLVEMMYSPVKKQPVQVRTIQRMLFPVDAETYQQLEVEKRLEGKRIKNLEGYFIVREQVTEYLFKQIEHSANRAVPFVISDRIVKTGEGQYTPAGEFSQYKLTVDN